jgi:hypothetical protein
MLWVGGQITTLPTLRDLVIPSAVSLLVPMAAMTAFAPEVQGEMKVEKEEEKQAVSWKGSIICLTSMIAT